MAARGGLSGSEPTSNAPPGAAGASGGVVEALQGEQGGVDNVAGCFYVGRGSLVIIITTITVGIGFQRHFYRGARVLIAACKIVLRFKGVVVGGLRKREADESMMVEVCGFS